MRLLMTLDTWRGFGGFGHRAQYTAVQTTSVSSNWHDVMNYFAGFKSFADEYVQK
jgi:hypothetical protein